MIDLPLGLDIDDDPLRPTTTEGVVRLVNEHMPEWLHEHGGWRLYNWFIDRRCRSCGLLRVEHADSLMGRCRAR